MSEQFKADELDRARVEYERRDSDPAYLARWSLLQPDVLRLVQSRDRRIASALRAAFGPDLSSVRALDVGCGAGSELLKLLLWGAAPQHLAGLDLSESRIETARKRLPTDVALKSGSADSLPWSDDEFDLVTQFTVMSSILNADLRQAVAREMLRVLRPGGLLLWYDMRREGVAASKWRAVSKESPTHWFSDEEVNALFPGASVRIQTATFAPWLATRVRSSVIYDVLSSVSWLHSHHLVLVRKR